MINRLYLKLFSLTLLIAFFAVGLQNCASRSVQMLHPQSGSTVSCGAAGVGIMAGGAEGFVEECVKSYEGRGYVPIEKLSLEQRTDLERRGILPKPEPPTFRMGY